MAKMNDVAPVVPLFGEHEKVKKEDIVDKEIEIIAFAKLNSEDGNYGVVAFRLEKKLQSCTVNASMVERLEEVADKIGLNEARSTKKELYFEETVVTKITSTETAKKRTFYSFE